MSLLVDRSGDRWKRGWGGLGCGSWGLGIRELEVDGGEEGCG